MPWALSSMEAAEGIIKIVNESMFGALRLVSVEQGYDPRDFALVGFGGAGPLHANALGILQSLAGDCASRPGVLCAYGDATHAVQDEAARTYLTMAGDLSDDKLQDDLKRLRIVRRSLCRRHPMKTHEITYQADLRTPGRPSRSPSTFSERT